MRLPRGRLASRGGQFDHFVRLRMMYLLDAFFFLRVL
jgi:hypothetical protein